MGKMRCLDMMWTIEQSWGGFQGSGFWSLTQKWLRHAMTVVKGSLGLRQRMGGFLIVALGKYILQMNGSDFFSSPSFFFYYY